MKERDLYNPCVRGALVEGWGLVRLEDGSPGRKPGDCFGIAPDGRGVLLECKVVEYAPKTFQPLPWKQFETHQIAWLSLYAQKGGYALAGIYHEATRELIVYRLREPAMQQDLSHEIHFQRLSWHPGHNLYTGWNGLLFDLKSPP